MAKEYIPIEKKKRKNYWAIIFLVFMVIGLSSSFVFFGFGDQTKKRYNGYTFHFKGDHWETKAKGQFAAFTNPPESVSSITFPADAKTLLSDKIQIDSTSLANDTFKDYIALSQYQMGLTMASYNSYLRVGFTTNLSQFPSITCASSTPFVPVVYFMAGNKTEIRTEGNCIIAQAQIGSDVVLLKDRLLYAMLGIA